MDTIEQKGTRQLKERREEVCQDLKEEIKSAIEMGSRVVAERFRDAVPYRPKLQNLKMMKAKAKRRWN
ncbi:hypothetical protein MTR67_030133 [Solanum verrucosum]|uniref:Uncharacterized protein n=1 Tax=Solanum verrucosum TaxID=315347 RepID=A0AAF0R8S0_SOLVR|nr:hypothetical protein MTR67_030133 [Solanum verrucosum]